MNTCLPNCSSCSALVMQSGQEESQDLLTLLVVGAKMIGVNLRSRVQACVRSSYGGVRFAAGAQAYCRMMPSNQGSWASWSSGACPGTSFARQCGVAWVLAGTVPGERCWELAAVTRHHRHRRQVPDGVRVCIQGATWSSMNQGFSAVALVILVLGAFWGSPALLLPLVSMGYLISGMVACLVRTGMSCFISVFYSTWGIGYWIVVVEAPLAEPIMHSLRYH